MQAFAAAGVELAVLEVGLGGRLDATTVHPDRQVLAFASIGLDHTEHLGPTIAAIATEKAGVLHGAAIAVSGPQPPEAAVVLEAVASRCQCPLRWVEPLAPAEQGGPVLGLLEPPRPWRNGDGRSTPPPFSKAYGRPAGRADWIFATSKADRCSWMGPTTPQQRQHCDGNSINASRTATSRGAG
jgi:hypothetical protein